MSDAPKREPKKSIMPPSRIAVIVFAVVAAVVVVFEWRARTAWDNTYAAVAKAMEEGHGLYKKDLDKYIQGDPTREESKEQESELFTWSGILQKYRMRLKYGAGGFIERIDQE